MSEFNKLIDQLDFWLINYSTNKTKTIDDQLFDIAKDIIDWVTANSWPSDFNNNDAKNLILQLSNKKDPLKRGEAIRLEIIYRVAKEEPAPNKIVKRGLSRYVWNHIGDKKFQKTSNIRFTDTEINNMIKFGMDKGNLPDSWIVGIITKAFRIPKPQTIALTETYLTNASMLLKPLSEGGRNGLLYCFKDENQKVIFQDKLKRHFIEKYGLTKYISENQQLVNTFYGGSVHTKTQPPDVDTVTYVSENQMDMLFDYALNNLDIALKTKNIENKEYEEQRESIIYRRSKSPMDRRVDINDFVFTELITVANPSNGIPYNIYNFHRMGKEIAKSSMNVNGKNIFKELNLDDTNPDDSIYKKLDFTFFTKSAAKAGKSIPPETQINF